MRVLIAFAALSVSVAAQPAPTVVPLDRALALAAERAVAVLQASAAVESAQARRAQARDALWPTLSASAGAGQRYGLAFDQTTGDLTQATVEALDVGLFAQAVVYDGGARKAQDRAATAAIEAALAGGDRARQQARSAVVERYLAVAQANAARDVARAEVEAQQRLAVEVQALVDLGARPASEVAQQQERLAAARGAVLDADRARALATADLVTLLGLDPAGDYAFPAPPETVDVAVPVGAMVERAIGIRADVRAAQAEVRAAQADVRLAVAARRPEIAVVGGAGTSFTSAAGDGLPGQLGGNRSGQLGLRVSLPILDRGSTRGSVRQSQARVDALRASADDAARMAALEVRRAAIVLADTEAQAELASVRSAAAEIALSAETARYQAGEITLQSVAQLRARAVDAATRRAVLAVTAQYQRLLLRLAVGDEI